MKLARVFFMAIVLMAASVTATYAQERLPQFLKHKVKPGETINSVAERYNVDVQDLLLLNDFPPEVMLTTNQVVLIRLLKNGEEAPMLEADYKDSKTTTAEKKVTATTVVTKKEETREAAPVQPKTQPATTTATAAATPAKAETVGPDGTKYKVSASEYHTVEKGQTFYRIALIYGLTVAELQALNNLSNTNIAVGQKLKVSK